MMMGYGAGLGFGYGGILVLLGCVLLVVGVVVLVAWAIGRTAHHGQSAMAQAPGPSQVPGQGAGDALEILRVRFARGEMTVDDYAAARQVLEVNR